MTEHETQTSKRSPMLTGMFRDRDSAERAYSCVTQRGYTKDDVTLLGIEDVGQVKGAWIEADGSVSVIRRRSGGG